MKKVSKTTTTKKGPASALKASGPNKKASGTKKVSGTKKASAKGNVRGAVSQTTTRKKSTSAAKSHVAKKTPRSKVSPRSKASKAASAKSPVKRSRIGRFFYYTAAAGVWGMIIGFLLIAYLSLDLPDLEDMPLPGAGDRAVIVKAANGAALVRNGPTYGDWIGFEETPDALVRAFIAVEDRQFFSHPGFDVAGFSRALLANVKAGGVRAGGSTLTQQLAKNLFLTNKRTLKRKVQELLLAFWLEQKFTKKQILTLYLNRVYFGGGTYGIDAASRKYFNHSGRRLSIAEAAMLAGLVKAPSRYAPHVNPTGAWERAQVVLNAMEATGSLTAAAAAKIKNQPPRLKQAAAGRDVRYFTDWLESKVRRLVPGSAGKSIIIHSTLDPAVQRAAAMAIDRGLSGEGKERGASQAALVAIDHDGAVRAMIGGSDYRRTQYNRAVQAERQPGSAFKLFSYLAALERGLKIDDRYTDKKITIEGWSPKNYSGTFKGEMTAREAFARSINTVAVEIAEEAGRENVARMAKRLGITTRVDALASLPLGTEEVKLIDLASAYAAVANGGHLAKAYGIIEVTTLTGEVIYRRPVSPPVPVLTYPVVGDITKMLTAVVKRGSGRRSAIDRPSAGKSGTSQDSRDAVFAGFTSDMTTAVWVGNDDGTPMKAVTGGGMPARIWADFMLEAHVGQPVRPLLADAGIYSAAAETDTKNSPQTKKKKKGFFKRLFGGD